LAILVHLHQSIEPEVRRVIDDGKIKVIDAFQYEGNIDSIASTIGAQPEQVAAKMELLEGAGLIRISRSNGTIHLPITKSIQSEPGTPGPRAPATSECGSATLAQFLEDYYNYLSVGFAPKTLENAKRVFSQFDRFILEKTLSRITSEDLERYKAFRKGRVSDSTINIDVRTIKAAFSVAEQWKRVERNPFAHVKQIRVTQQRLKHFSNAEFDALIGNIRDPGFKELVVFAALTGLRRGEILNLRWSDFDADGPSLHIQSTDEYRVKGGKMRTIALHPQVREILDSRPRDHKWVFCTSKGQPYRGDHVQKLFKKSLRESGLPEHFHFHSLRHTFGTWAANAGVPIHIIKQMMGHSSVKTTEMYAGIDQGVMAEQIRKVSPRGSLLG
jgi:integrase